MGSVFQNEKGRWIGTVELPRGRDGKRKKKFFYGITGLSDAKQEKELWSRVNALEYEIENNLYMNESDATLEEYLKDWHKVYTADLAETTRELYKLYMDKHIIPSEIGNLKIKKLLPIQLQEFYNKKAETLSGKSVAKLHSFLNLALKDAMKNRLIMYNPCDGVNKPKSKKFKPTLYSEENFNKLTNIVVGTFDEVCILLAGVCGLRRGEIFGLRLRDIDFKEYRISIVETMVRMNTDWIIKDPKSESSQRNIKIPKFVIEVISEYLTSLKVVPERICGKYKPSAYSQHFKKLLEDNGLPHIRFHDLRHFNASIMMKYGVRDKIASDRLGHSQVQMTRHYQHSSSDMDSEASNMLEDIFTNKDKTKKAGT
jgi:integrase